MEYEGDSRCDTSTTGTVDGWWRFTTQLTLVIIIHVSLDWNISSSRIGVFKKLCELKKYSLQSTQAITSSSDKHKSPGGSYGSSSSSDSEKENMPDQESQRNKNGKSVWWRNLRVSL